MIGGRRPGAGVRARDWGYRYPGRPDPALRHAGFEIAPGELVVLMGASGSGKSTLLAALAGTLPESESWGDLQVDHDARIGLVQQEPEANIVMELVGDDVAFPLENAAVPPERLWDDAVRAAEAVGLGVGLQAPTATLSGGQQQLLAVAAAAAAGPGLLLLDEPTANLDPASADRLLAAVRQVRQATGCTVVVVEHRVLPWLADADQVLLAVDGTIVAMPAARVDRYLAGRPAVAAHVWLDPDLPARRPARPPGGPVLVAEGLAVRGRLAPITLELRAGEVVALTGPPGAGKSTLLSCLAGLQAPTDGTVRMLLPEHGAADPWRWSAQDVASVFGVVFQNPEHQFVTGSVGDEVRHGLIGAGVGTDEAAGRTATILRRFRLDRLAGADPFTLSGGEQRRLSVATALVLDPRILLLDEPTFGQDPVTWAEVVDVVAEHRDAGGAVVLATHDPQLVSVLGAREVRLPPPAPPPAAAHEAPVHRQWLRRLDPLALLAGAGLVSAAALVSASVALNASLVAVCLLTALLGGLPGRRALLIAAPALLAGASVGFSNALLSSGGLGSADSWTAAALPASRVLAVALPGLIAAVALDPTRLADALVMRLRVPPRAAYSVLAGLRLIPLLAAEWTVLSRADRARGLGGRGLRQRLAALGSGAFRLLVAALRRGSRLALALEARGLRSGSPRTVARPPHWSHAASAVLAAGALALLAAALTRW